jgi:hypothetical protein
VNEIEEGRRDNKHTWCVNFRINFYHIDIMKDGELVRVLRSEGTCQLHFVHFWINWVRNVNVELSRVGGWIVAELRLDESWCIAFELFLMDLQD